MYRFRRIHWIHGLEGWLTSKNTFCTKTRTWVQIPNSLVRSQAWLHICLPPWCCQGKETGGWLARADSRHRVSERPFLNRKRQRVIEHLMFSSGLTAQDPVMPIYHTPHILIHKHTRGIHSLDMERTIVRLLWLNFSSLHKPLRLLCQISEN